MESMVTVTDGRNGLAVFSAGMPEYEVMTRDTTIALTLLRCVDLLGDIPPEGYSKEQCISDFTPGAQCLREYEFRYGIFPYEGDVDGGQVKRECERFVHPMRTFQLPADRQSWEGFRPGAPKFFDYFEDEASRLPEPGVKLPAELSLLRVDDADVVLSAVKFPELRDQDTESKQGAAARSAVVRLINYSHASQYAAIGSDLEMASARLLRMSEEPIKALSISEHKSVNVTLSPKQVLTVLVRFAP
jgi:alpha-mannosidase